MLRTRSVGFMKRMNAHFAPSSLPQAGHCCHQRPRARRRQRAGAVLRLPCHGRGRPLADRPDGIVARHHSRRGRHPAAAATDWKGGALRFLIESTRLSAQRGGGCRMGRPGGRARGVSGRGRCAFRPARESRHLRHRDDQGRRAAGTGPAGGRRPRHRVGELRASSADHRRGNRHHVLLEQPEPEFTGS